MNKRCCHGIAALLALLALGVLAGCTGTYCGNPTSGGIADAPASLDDALSTQPESDPFWSILDQGRNYVVLHIHDTQDYVYLVFNNEQELVHHHTWFKDNIIEREDGTLQIIFNYGSSEPGVLYYEPELDRFSQEYNGDTIIAEGYGLIAYLDWYRDSKTQEIINKFVVQDMYDASAFYAEYERPIAGAMVARNAVIEAAFLDEDTLHITYYIGERMLSWPLDNVETATEIIRFREP